QKAGERVGDRRGQEGVVVDHRGRARVVRVQVLIRQRIDVANDLDVVAVVADVLRLGDQAAGQLALEPDLPARLMRDLRVLVEERDGLAEGGLLAEGVSDRLQDGRVRERGGERERQ